MSYREFVIKFTEEILNNINEIEPIRFNDQGEPIVFNYYSHENAFFQYDTILKTICYIDIKPSSTYKQQYIERLFSEHFKKDIKLVNEFILI